MIRAHPQKLEIAAYTEIISERYKDQIHQTVVFESLSRYHKQCSGKVLRGSKKEVYLCAHDNFLSKNYHHQWQCSASQLAGIVIRDNH